MTNKKFKELITNNTKHQLIWKIVKDDLKINSVDKNKNLTKKQYEKILNKEA